MKRRSFLGGILGIVGGQLLYRIEPPKDLIECYNHKIDIKDPIKCLVHTDCGDFVIPFTFLNSGVFEAKLTQITQSFNILYWEVFIGNKITHRINESRVIVCGDTVRFELKAP